MTPSLKSLGDGYWQVTFGSHTRDYKGGIDHVMQVASIWIRGGCK